MKSALSGLVFCNPAVIQMIIQRNDINRFIKKHDLRRTIRREEIEEDNLSNTSKVPKVLIVSIDNKPLPSSLQSSTDILLSQDESPSWSLVSSDNLPSLNSSSY